MGGVSFLPAVRAADCRLKVEYKFLLVSLIAYLNLSVVRCGALGFL